MARHVYFRIVGALLVIQTLKLLEPVNGAYQYAAVNTDVGSCSTMGRNILQRGGSAMDAAITSVLCVGVINAQSSGIGGGLSMVVYINKTAEALMATEKAPSASSPDMFASRDASKYGVESVAVPGEVQGLWEAHQLYGVLPWNELFEPVIEMAEDGFQVTKHLAYVLKYNHHKYQILRDLYSRPNGDRMLEGDNLTLPLLAQTLRTIASEGPESFYTGSIANDMLLDIEEADGIITGEDFENYTVLVKHDVTSTSFKNNITMFSAPLTSSGPVLQFILNVLDGALAPSSARFLELTSQEVLEVENARNKSTTDMQTKVYIKILKAYDVTEDDFSTFEKKLRLYHRFLEIGKFAFALRSHLGDEPTSSIVQDILSALNSKEFAQQTAALINDTYVAHESRYGYDDISNGFLDENDEEEGLGDTAHVSVLASNGDAVSVTSSVGYYFGSKFYSNRTGVFLNNHMANFYFPNRESHPVWRWPTANRIAPNRRYLTTVCPSLLVDDKKNVKMVVGASGGSRIVSTNAWVILRTIWMGASLSDAVDEKRICNYLPSSNSAYYENRFPETQLLDELAQMGHLTRHSYSYAVCQAILRNDDGDLDAYSDPRKGGDSDGY